MRASPLFFGYGAFLMAGGLIAFAMAGFEAKAKTAVIMGVGCGLVMWLCAFLGQTRPAAIKAARFLAAFFLALFAFRGYKIRDVPEKQYLLYTFILLSLGSALTLLASVLLVKSDRSGNALKDKTALAAALNRAEGEGMTQHHEHASSAAMKKALDAATVVEGSKKGR